MIFQRSVGFYWASAVALVSPPVPRNSDVAEVWGSSRRTGARVVPIEEDAAPVYGNKPGGLIGGTDRRYQTLGTYRRYPTYGTNRRHPTSGLFDTTTSRRSTAARIGHTNTSMNGPSGAVTLLGGRGCGDCLCRSQSRGITPHGKAGVAQYRNKGYQILVAFDGSEESARAIEYGCHIGSVLDASITVAYACNPTSTRRCRPSASGLPPRVKAVLTGDRSIFTVNGLLSRVTHCNHRTE